MTVLTGWWRFWCAADLICRLCFCLPVGAVLHFPRPAHALRPRLVVRDLLTWGSSVHQHRDLSESVVDAEIDETNTKVKHKGAKTASPAVRSVGEFGCYVERNRSSWPLRIDSSLFFSPFAPPPTLEVAACVWCARCGGGRWNSNTMRSMECALLCHLLLAGLFLSFFIPSRAVKGASRHTVVPCGLSFCVVSFACGANSPLRVFPDCLTHSHRLQQWLFVLVFAMKRQDVW